MPLPDGLHLTSAMSAVAAHENLRVREVRISCRAPVSTAPPLGQARVALARRV